MPCISRFHGITIYVYGGDHNPPHFHAKYAGQDVAIEMATLDVIVGRLAPRAMALVRAWAQRHRVELLDDWRLAQAGEPAVAIEPLA
jgi:hypothetical protein